MDSFYNIDKIEEKLRTKEEMSPEEFVKNELKSMESERKKKENEFLENNFNLKIDKRTE